LCDEWWWSKAEIRRKEENKAQEAPLHFRIVAISAATPFLGSLSSLSDLACIFSLLGVLVVL
jgi:hypothetical protein